MSQHVTIHVRAHNEHSVVQRMLLLFSRRRLRIQALQMFDLQAGRPAEIQIDLDCDLATSRNLVAQLARIVEVCEAWCEHVPRQDTGDNEAALRVA